MTAPQDLPAPVLAPEDAKEREMFDSTAKTFGSPLEAVAVALTIWGRMKPGGSFGEQCIIMANEVRLAAHRRSDPVRGELVEALRKIVDALCSDAPSGPQKTIGRDDTIYHLDGQKMYHAINGARDALTLANKAEGHAPNQPSPKGADRG